MKIKRKQQEEAAAYKHKDILISLNFYYETE